MKAIILTTLLGLLVLQGCDAPRRTRDLTGTYGSGVSYNGSNGFDPTETSSSTGSTGTSTTGTSGGETLTTGFTHCTNLTSHFLVGQGQLTVCQSSVDETRIRASFGFDSQGTRTCLIPTYKNEQGSSTYLGQPQCANHTLNQIIIGSLYKNRNGFTHYPLNGLMIMKENAVQPYYNCMNAYSTFSSPQCPYGAQTNAYCATLASNYMTNLCGQFQNNYSFLDVRLN